MATNQGVVGSNPASRAKHCSQINGLAPQELTRFSWAVLRVAAALGGSLESAYWFVAAAMGLSGLAPGVAAIVYICTNVVDSAACHGSPVR